MHIHAQRKWIWFWSGSYHKVALVQSLHDNLYHNFYHDFYHNFYHKINHNCGLGVQGKLSGRTWHYPRCRGLPCSGGSLPQKKNPSWEEPLQKSQFLTENSLKMSHFRPTSRGEDLGEHLDVFRWQAIVEGVLQVSQVRRQMVGTCGKRFMWLKMKGGATCLAETANQVVQPTRIALFKFCIVKGRFMT